MQRYSEYAGFLNKPKVQNVRITFDAADRSRTMDWFTLTTEQYNFFDRSERLFFLKASLKGLPTAGYHLYKDGEIRYDDKVIIAHTRGKGEGG